MTNNTLENRIIGQPRDLPQPIRTGSSTSTTTTNDESSETVEEFLTYETDIEESTWQELDVHERLDLARQEGFEPSPQEIFEWWLVSDWLADRLREFEQPVLLTTAPGGADLYRPGHQDGLCDPEDCGGYRLCKI